jgi:sterol-4alpha-carboxylate 3-dehydrogenase (decarboxylating)
VTGGSGFLGAALVQQLLANPATSVAITSRNPVRGDGRVLSHAADLASEKDIQAVFDSFQSNVVVHTASLELTDQASILASANILGIKTSLKRAKLCSETRAFVYTSSGTVVGSTQEPLTGFRYNVR